MSLMASFSPEVGRLFSTSPGHLPLIKAAFRPDPDACRVRPQDPAILFPGARNSQAALAGLLLRIGCWDESHAVAQDIDSTEGSYWHGIIHRLEPDSANASYWFRQVGQHSVFPELFIRTVEILKQGGPEHWHPKTEWDPFLFIDWCDEARERGGPAETAALEIQMAEWQLLFDWCAAKRHIAHS
jgi:hypothetical protein